MAAYTCDLRALHAPSGDYRSRLWADDPAELMELAVLIGCTLDDVQPNTAFFNFLVTPMQQALAISYGAQLTDYQGPRYWLAQQRGDTALCAVIDKGREEVRAITERHRAAKAMYERSR